MFYVKCLLLTTKVLCFKKSCENVSVWRWNMILTRKIDGNDPSCSGPSVYEWWGWCPKGCPLALSLAIHKGAKWWFFFRWVILNIISKQAEKIFKNSKILWLQLHGSSKIFQNFSGISKSSATFITKHFKFQLHNSCFYDPV